MIHMRIVSKTKKTKTGNRLSRLDRLLDKYAEAAPQSKKELEAYKRELINLAKECDVTLSLEDSKDGGLSGLVAELKTAASLIVFANPSVKKIKKGAAETDDKPMWERELVEDCNPSDTETMHRNLEILMARLNHVATLRMEVMEIHNETRDVLYHSSKRTESLQKEVEEKAISLSGKKVAKSMAIASALGAATGWAVLPKIIHSHVWAVVIGGGAAVICVAFNLLTSKLEQRGKVRKIKEHKAKMEWHSQDFDARYPTLFNNVANAVEGCSQGVDELIDKLLPIYEQSPQSLKNTWSMYFPL